MAAKTPNARRKRTAVNPDLERLESLPWNPSLPDVDDPFSLFVGSDELEGGFLSLEEIDESEYGLEIHEPGPEDKKGNPKQSKKSKKRKSSGDNDSSGDGVEDGTEEEVVDKKNFKKKKKKKKVTKKNQANEESATGNLTHFFM